MMIIFPSAVIHCVNPYTGKTPRVTMSWNINRFSVAGSPFLDDLDTGREQQPA